MLLFRFIYNIKMINLGFKRISVSRNSYPTYEKSALNKQI